MKSWHPKSKKWFFNHHFSQAFNQFIAFYNSTHSSHGLLWSKWRMRWDFEWWCWMPVPTWCVLQMNCCRQGSKRMLIWTLRLTDLCSLLVKEYWPSSGGLDWGNLPRSCVEEQAGHAHITAYQDHQAFPFCLAFEPMCGCSLGWMYTGNKPLMGCKLSKPHCVLACLGKVVEKFTLKTGVMWCDARRHAGHVNLGWQNIHTQQKRAKAAGSICAKSIEQSFDGADVQMFNPTLQLQDECKTNSCQTAAKCNWATRSMTASCSTGASTTRSSGAASPTSMSTGRGTY